MEKYPNFQYFQEKNDNFSTEWSLKHPAPKNEYWWPFFDPCFFPNEYWKRLTGPNFEYWPLETRPLDIIMRVIDLMTRPDFDTNTKQLKQESSSFQKLIAADHPLIFYFSQLQKRNSQGEP